MTMTPLSGEQLQAARKAAAERYTAIAMKYVPESWTVQFRKSLSGKCYYCSKTISAPKPVTRKSLYIFLHECGHANLHAPLVFNRLSEYRKKPKHVIELEAEQWAHERMRENGVAVPRSMTIRAKKYVGRKVNQAVARGSKNIDPRARHFANMK